MRIGFGYDVHALAKGRALVLGGVAIPWEKGLLGHSDADVLLHAVMDAILGAAGAGDIGQHFPDTDESLRGISSLVLLRKTNEIIKGLGFSIGNVDATVVAERPKIAPYIPAMRCKMAEVLHVTENRINVKATTNERLGFIGRGEGIAAFAVVLLSERE